jgi:hypothetical protein
MLVMADIDCASENGNKIRKERATAVLVKMEYVRGQAFQYIGTFKNERPF